MATSRVAVQSSRAGAAIGALFGPDALGRRIVHRFNRRLKPTALARGGYEFAEGESEPADHNEMAECSLLVFGITVQLTPGFVGQFEAAIVAALALYRVPNDLASSYAIAFHAITFLPIVLLGAWSLARTPLALRELRTPDRA